MTNPSTTSETDRLRIGIAADHGGFELFSGAERHRRRLAKESALEGTPTKDRP